MKHFFFIFTCVSVIFTGSLFAQKAEKDKAAKEDEPSKNYFYTNPFGIFGGSFDLSYERCLKNHNSFMLTGGLTLSKTRNKSRNGGEGELHYRVNMSKHPSNVGSGIQMFTFFAPYLRGEYQEIYEPNNYYSPLYNSTTVATSGSASTFVRSFSGGLLFGFRVFSSDNRFSAALYGGGGLKISDVQGNQNYTNTFSSGYTGIVPKFGAQIGISF